MTERNSCDVLMSRLLRTTANLKLVKLNKWRRWPKRAQWPQTVHPPYIKLFVSDGPKVYAYVMRTLEGDRREVCKIKDVTLNFTNPRMINFKTVKNLLLALEKRKGEEEETVARETSIKLRFRVIRRTAFHDIVTRAAIKTCTPVLLKRVFNETGYSVPYGYATDNFLLVLIICFLCVNLIKTRLHRKLYIIT